MAVVPKQNALDLLRNLVPLNTLREDALAELLNAVNFEKLKKGDYLFHEGDTDTQRVYLLSGRVALKSGRSEVDSISSGSSLAKFPLAHNIPRKFSVVAKIKTEIVRIDNELLSKLIAKGDNAEYQVSEVDVEASNDWMSQLLQSPAFQQIPAANIQNVMMRMEQQEVEAGDIIINQGEEGDYFYLINKGVCSIHRSVDGGESKEIVKLGAGDSFGEDSLLSGKPRTSSVTMLSDGILLRLGRDDFVEYVRQPLADIVDYDEAVARVAKGAVWLDVRTKSEHLARRIPDSVLMPIEAVRKPGMRLDQDKRYIIYCDDGQISMTASYLLYERGIDATVLENGLTAVPADELETASAAEGATIINLRPDQGRSAGRSSQIDTGADEQALLKDRLTKTEEQLAATRKIKQLLKKSEEKLSAIEKEKAAESKENRQLNEALSRFKSELAQQKIELNTAVTERESAEEIAVSLNKADDQLRDELSDAAKRTEEIESRLKEQEKVFADKEGQHQALQRSLDETRAEQTRMEEALAESADERARLQSELEASGRQTKVFEDQIAAHEKEAIERQTRDKEVEAEQQSQQQVLQQTLDDVQAERLKADEKLAELNGEQERLQNELKASVERLEKRDNQLAAQEKAEAELLSQQEAQQQTLDETRSEQTRMEEMLAELRDEQVRLQSELETSGRQTKEFEDQIAAHEIEAIERQKRDQEAGAEQQSQQQELQQALDDAQAERLKADEKLAELSGEQERLQSELKASVERFEERDSQLAAQEKAEAELLSQQEALQQTLDEARAGQTQMEETLAELRDEQARLQSELEASTEQVNELDSQIVSRDKADLEQQERDREAEASWLQRLDDAGAGGVLANEKLAEVTREQERLQDELAVSCKQAEELVSQLAAREEAEANQLSQQQSLQQTLDEARAGQIQMEETLAELRDEQAHLQSELEASAKQVNELDDQINSRDKADLEQQERDCEAEVSWQQRLDDAEKERVRADERLSEVGREQERLQDDFAASCKQVEELEGQLVAQDKADAQQQRLKSELETSGRRVEELESQLDAQGQTETEQQADNRALKQLLDEAQAEQAQKADKLEELSGEQARLQSELEISAKQVNELDDQINSRDKADLEQQERDREAEVSWQQRLDDAEKERARADERLSEVSHEQERLQDDFEASCKQVEELEGQLVAQDKADAEQQRLKNELETSGRRVEELESQLDAQGQTETEQQADNRALKQLLDEAQAEQAQKADKLEELSGEQARLNSELEVSGDRVEEVEGQLATLDQTNAEQQSQLHLLQQSLDEAHAEQAETNERLSTLSSECDHFESELDVSTRRVEELENEGAAQGLTVTEQQQEQQALKKLLDEAETGQEEVSGRLSTLTSERDRLQSELDESGRQVKELENQIIAQKQAGNEQLAEQQRQQSSLAESQAERDQQLSDLHDDYKQLQIELDESTSLIEAFEKAQKEKETTGIAVDGQIESLRQELEEANSALRVAEEHLAMRKQSLGGVVSENSEVKILKAELETLTGALEESDKAHDEILQERDEQLVVVDRLREELEIANSRPSDESAAVLPVQDGVVAELEKELQEVRDSLKEYKLLASADAAEGEALRQDMDSFRHSLDERSDELNASRKGQLLLEERIEERNSEIDRLKQALEMAQLEAEEAEFSRTEALEAKKQVEQALYSTREQIEEARPRDDLADSRFIDSGEAIDISGGSSLKKIVVGAVLGAAVAFGVAEGLSIMGGGGELISGMLADDPVQPQLEKIAQIPPVPAGQVEKLVEKKPLTPPVQQTAKSEVSDKIAAKTDKPLRPRSEQVDKPVETEKKPARIPIVPKGPETGSVIRDLMRSGGRGPVMVYIRGGDFIMGSDRSQLASEERPAHRVAMESYAIGRFEVTFDEYAAFAEATGRRLPDDLGWGQGRRPVMNVNWEDASAYASWLSDQTGRRYRLPTEAEWEHAASGGSDTAFWWGYMFENNRANCFDCGSRWDASSTAPAGSFDQNGYSLHNTAGNVMEWVEDCYHDSYLGSPTDGSAWVEPGCSERVVRGGAFNKPADSMRTTRRSRHSADTRLFVLGFRLVRDVE